jgi:O-antigen/teichoic acid export membrane protein
MLQALKKTVKHTAIYGLGNLSTKLIGLILLPLYTSRLTTAEYGMLSMLEVTSLFFITLVGLGLSTGMMRWCASETDETKKKSIVFTIISSLFVLTLLLNLLLYPFNKHFSVLFFENQNFAVYFQYLWMWVALEVINKVVLDLIRINEKPVFFVTVVITKLLTILLLNIYFVVVLKKGVEGIILSQVLGNASLLLICFFFLLKNIRFSFLSGILINIAKFSVPLVLATVSTYVLMISDRYLIQHFLSYSEVGIYSLGYKISSVIYLFVIQSFSLSFAPTAYKIYDQPTAKPYFAKVTTYFTLVMVLLALILIFYSPEIIRLFASAHPEYVLAYTVIPLLCLSFILRGMNHIVSLGLHFVKKTKYNALIVFVLSVVNILLNILLIPYWGIMGVAIVSVFTNLIMLLLFYMYTQRFYHIRYEIVRIIKLLASAIMFFVIVSLLSGLNPLVWVVLKTVLLVMFPLFLYVIGFFDRKEIEHMKGSWKKWKNPGKLFKNLRNF